MSRRSEPSSRAWPVAAVLVATVAVFVGLANGDRSEPYGQGVQLSATPDGRPAGAALTPAGDPAIPVAVASVPKLVTQDVPRTPVRRDDAARLYTRWLVQQHRCEDALQIARTIEGQHLKEAALMDVSRCR